MKKILFVTFAASLMACNRKALVYIPKKPNFPLQELDNRQEVQVLRSFYMGGKPIVQTVGSRVLLFDEYNRGWILLSTADTVLQHFERHLNTPVYGLDQNSQQFQLTPVVMLTETNAPAFTMFTARELARESKEDRERLLKLSAESKIFIITKIDDTYVESMKDEDLAAMMQKPEPAPQLVAPPAMKRYDKKPPTSTFGGVLRKNENP